MGAAAKLMWGILALCLACAPVYADDPKPGEKPKPTPKSRRDLSPLARNLDDLLFGKGPADVSPYQFNLFKVNLDARSFAWALEEVRYLRGAEFTALESKGSEVIEKFSEGIKKGVIEKARSENLGVTSWRYVGQSFAALRADGRNGEKALDASEVHVRALQRTQEQFPLPFMSSEGQGTEDPDAKGLYQRNAHRIDTFESKPDLKRLERDTFEAWREKKVKELADRLSEHLTRMVLHDMQNGVRDFYWENPALGPTPSTRDLLSLSPEELKAAIRPIEVHRVVNGNQVSYEISRGLKLRSPDGRSILSAKWENLKTDRQVSQETQEGELNIERAAEVHLLGVLERENVTLLKTIEALNAYQYSHYKEDGGKRFLANLTKLNREGMARLNKKFSVPSHTWSLDHLKNVGPGFEVAVWGKFAEDPKFWTKPQEYRGMFAELVFGNQKNWGELSAVPPPPRSETLTKFAKTYGPIPMVLAALAAGYWNLPPPKAQATQGQHDSSNAVEGTNPSAHDTVTKPKPEAGAVRLDPKSETKVKIVPPKEGKTELVIHSPPAEPPKAMTLEEFENHRRENPVEEPPATAHNKTLPKESEARTSFRLSPVEDAGVLPRRFSVPSGARAVLEAPVPDPSLPTAFHVGTPQAVSGTLAVPTGDGSQFSEIRIEGQDGRPWERGVDYELRATDAGEIVVFPKTSEPYVPSIGFSKKAADTRPVQHPDLKAMDHAKLKAISKELSENRFVYLPALIDEALKVSEASGRPFSLFDLSDILQQSAYYSQLPENREKLVGLRTEIERASRFLDPDGIACYQCDGARELGVVIYRKATQKPEEIEIRPRYVIARKADSMDLTTNGAHADFEIADHVNQQRFVMDTTPFTADPRDPNPPNAEQSSYVDKPDHGAAEEGREKLALDVGDPAKLKRQSNVPPATVKQQGEVPPTTPHSPVDTDIYRKMLQKLLQTWNDGEIRRPFVNEPRPKPAIASGPPPTGDAPEKPFAEAKQTAPAKTHVVPPIEKRSGKWVPDEKVDALNARITSARTVFGNMRLVAKQTAGGFASLPSLDVVLLGRLIERRLRNEINDVDFEKEARRFVPDTFEFPLGSIGRKIKAVAAAARETQLGKIDALRKLWEARKSREYPRLLDPQAAHEISAALKWIEERDWAEPQFVYDTPFTCNEVAAAIAP